MKNVTLMVFDFAASLYNVETFIYVIKGVRGDFTVTFIVLQIAVSFLECLFKVERSDLEILWGSEEAQKP